VASSPQLDAGLMDEIVRRIVRKVDPLKVILFGSHARGDARPDSDVDLMVIKDSSEPRYRRAGPIYTLLADLSAEVEVMVYTPEEVRQWAPVEEAFATTALCEGKVLYEREG